MPYGVTISARATRDLDRINGADLTRLKTGICALISNPRPMGVKKLTGILHRIRIGDWRILYAIQDKKKVVTILRVLRRSERTYKNL